MGKRSRQVMNNLQPEKLFTIFTMKKIHKKTCKKASIIRYLKLKCSSPSVSFRKDKWMQVQADSLINWLNGTESLTWYTLSPLPKDNCG